MKKGICSPLEGSVNGIMKIMETVVTKMDAAMCYGLHKKPEMTPALQKVPVNQPQNTMHRKPSF